MNRTIKTTVSAVLALAAWGCSGSDSKDDDVQATDTVVTDTGLDDTAIDVAPDRAEGDTEGPDAGPDQASGDSATPDVVEDLGPVDELGFQIRKPKTGYEVKCSQGGGTPGDDAGTFDDRDFVCTFKYKDWDGYLYFQATATDCKVLMGPSPIYTAEGAWLSLGGVVTPVDNPMYDIGGNHQNDFFEFDYEGIHFKYYHSSFGFGWRVCQPMDCIQVLEGLEVVEDGCVPKERSLPIVCVPVAADGTYPELVDTFQPCAGDDNW
jgi:hypothetical protein